MLGLTRLQIRYMTMKYLITWMHIMRPKIGNFLLFAFNLSSSTFLVWLCVTVDFKLGPLEEIVIRKQVWKKNLLFPFVLSWTLFWTMYLVSSLIDQVLFCCGKLERDSGKVIGTSQSWSAAVSQSRNSKLKITNTQIENNKFTNRK